MPHAPQLVAVGGVSLLMLAVGMIAPANWVNLRLSAPDVGGAIMSPSMSMDRDTPSLARGLFLPCGSGAGRTPGSPLVRFPDALDREINVEWTLSQYGAAARCTMSMRGMKRSPLLGKMHARD